MSSHVTAAAAFNSDDMELKPSDDVIILTGYGFFILLYFKAAELCHTSRLH